MLARKDFEQLGLTTIHDGGKGSLSAGKVILVSGENWRRRMPAPEQSRRKRANLGGKIADYY